MSRLIETIRVAEGRLENIEYHFRRMGRRLEEILEIDLPPQGVHKLRIVYDAKGYSFDITPYKIRPVRSLKLVVNDKIRYDRKFEDRTELNEMFNQREDCDDVLIVKDNLVTDASYANIIFKEGSRWFTPDSFLLNGTMRQFLLDRKLIAETHITPKHLSRFSHFKLINAMLRNEAPESEILNIR